LESGKLLHAEWQRSNNTFLEGYQNAKPTQGISFFRSKATMQHKDRIMCSANTQYILLLKKSIPCGN
jgi:hypothetical protein